MNKAQKFVIRTYNELISELNTKDEAYLQTITIVWRRFPKGAPPEYRRALDELYTGQYADSVQEPKYYEVRCRECGSFIGTSISGPQFPVCENCRMEYENVEKFMNGKGI